MFSARQELERLMGLSEEVDVERGLSFNIQSQGDDGERVPLLSSRVSAAGYVSEAALAAQPADIDVMLPESNSLKRIPRANVPYLATDPQDSKKTLADIINEIEVSSSIINRADDINRAITLLSDAFKATQRDATRISPVAHPLSLKGITIFSSVMAVLVTTQVLFSLLYAIKPRKVPNYKDKSSFLNYYQTEMQFGWGNSSNGCYQQFTPCQELWPAYTLESLCDERAYKDQSRCIALPMDACVYDKIDFCETAHEYGNYYGNTNCAIDCKLPYNNTYFIVPTIINAMMLGLSVIFYLIIVAGSMDSSSRYLTQLLTLPAADQTMISALLKDLDISSTRWTTLVSVILQLEIRLRQAYAANNRLVKTLTNHVNAKISEPQPTYFDILNKGTDKMYGAGSSDIQSILIPMILNNDKTMTAESTDALIAIVAAIAVAPVSTVAALSPIKVATPDITIDSVDMASEAGSDDVVIGPAVENASAALSVEPKPISTIYRLFDASNEVPSQIYKDLLKHEDVFSRFARSRIGRKMGFEC